MRERRRGLRRQIAGVGDQHLSSFPILTSVSEVIRLQTQHRSLLLQAQAMKSIAASRTRLEAGALTSSEDDRGRQNAPGVEVVDGERMSERLAGRLPKAVSFESDRHPGSCSERSRDRSCGLKCLKEFSCRPESAFSGEISS